MTTTAPDRQPSTPGQAQREIVAYIVDRAVAAGARNRSATLKVADDILRQVRAGELDAAPTVYALPAEPPEGTRLWTRHGTAVTASRSHGDDPYLWWDAEGEIYRWAGVLGQLAPLSTAPPEPTEAS